MRTSSDRLRRYIRARREELEQSQGDLAKTAGVARNTVASLERGLALREGKESLIERALGWELGSIDAIRDGGEPQLTDPGTTSDEVGLRDENERQIWEMRGLPEDLRWTYIHLYRGRQQHDGGYRQAQ